MVEEALEIHEQILDHLLESDAAEKTAKFYWKFYSALLDKGFMPKEAMELLTAHEPFNYSMSK